MIDFIAGNNWLFYTIIIVLGLAIGSFVNVIIYRLPIMLEREWQNECLEFMGKQKEFKQDVKRYNLARPSSRCPFCNTPLTFWQNIPIISYVILGGKCAHCQSKIPLRYLIVEILSAALSVVVATQFGLSWSLVAILLFTWILIAICFIDIDHQILPDILTLPLLWLGLFVSCFNLFINSHDAILGAIFGYLFLWLVGGCFKLITKKEGIGQGDFKLLAAIGAWVGWQILPFVIITSSILGLIFGVFFLLITRQSKNTPIPFGPFIVIAGFVAVIWGFDITQHYLQLFSIPMMTDI